MKKKNSDGKKVQIPLTWRICSWFATVLLAIGILAVFYYKVSKGEPNPYHPFDPLETAGFGLVFGGLGAAIVKMLIIDKVLLRIAQKRSAVEIVEGVAKDVACTAVGVAVQGVVDGVTGSSGSSSSDSVKGGGGESGGGGASGGY